MNKRQRKKAEQKQTDDLKRTEARLAQEPLEKRRWPRLTPGERRALEPK